MTQFKYLSRQAGVSIVTAIFLLVVLSGLGAAIVTLSAGQHASSALDLLGSRAYEAARSGLQYGLYRHENYSQECLSSTSFSFTPATMSTFTVTVQCIKVDSANMPNGMPKQTTITATACNQPTGTGTGTCPNGAPSSPDYVQRVVTVQF